jgi:hypothetical protein
VPQLAKGLLRRPQLRCPQPRLRGLRLATPDGPGAAQHSTAAVHATAAEHAASAQHSATTEHAGVQHAAAAQHTAADEHMAEAAEHPGHDDADAIELPQLGKGLHPRARPQHPRARLRRLGHAASADQLVAEADNERAVDVDADGIKLPRMGKGLHPRSQSRSRLRGHAGDNRGAVEWLESAAGVDRRDATAGVDGRDTAAGVDGRDTAAGVDWRHPAAGVDWRDPAAWVEWLDAAARLRGLDAAAWVDAAAAQRLPDADTYAPGPQRAVDSASTPAVLPAAAADLAPH